MNSKVLRLMDLAMEISQARKADAFVDYHGHCNMVHYRAHPASQPYEEDSEMVNLIPHTSIYMNSRGAEAEMDRAIEQFEQLLKEVGQ